MVRFRIISIIILAFLPTLLLAQKTDSTYKDDPFKRDPYFTKPLPELLRTPPQSWPEDNITESVTRLSTEGIDGSGVYQAPLIYQQYPVLPANHFNRVDGLTLGFRKDRMKWFRDDWFLDIPQINLTGTAAYSFGIDEWQYSLGLERRMGRKKHFLLGGEFHDATTTDDFWRVGINETTLTALGTSHDFLDYYNQQGFGVYAAYRTDRLFEFSLSYNNDDYDNVQQNTEFSFFGKDKNLRANQLVDSTEIESIAMGVSFNPKRVIMSDFFTFSADFFAEFADLDGFNNDFAFNKYETETKLFFKIDQNTNLNLRFKTGSITGHAPIQRLYELGGIGSLRARPFKAFAGNNQMLLANTELQFGRPDHHTGWLDLSSFYLSLFLDSGWTHFDEDQQNRNNPFKGYKDFNFDDVENDFGIGVGSNLFRFEIAWRADNLDRAPALWLRFNPTF